MVHPITLFVSALLILFAAISGVVPDGDITSPEFTATSQTAPDAGSVGIFEAHGDIGTVLHPGSITFDRVAKSYTVSASGENMWFAKDAFHFAWKKVTGDCALAADIAFVGKGTDPHRKACLMLRQSLDADAAYVDAAIHGDGLTSLQFRDAKGGATHEVQANVSAPVRLRIEKRGKYALMYLAAKGEELKFSGAAVRLALDEPFYVGIGVCAHNKDVVEKAVFSNVELIATLTTSSKPVLYSTLETQSMASTDRRVVHVTPTRIEAPNWLRDGKTLIYNSGGRLYRIPIAGGKPEAIDTGFANRCNNDHGVSPDGKLLVLSDQSQGKRQSLIYTLPVAGGKPKLVTPNGPSYWHGWSPDGNTLAYCAERNGEFDVYTIPADGGEEKRLTTAKGLDDGPEYSPDGKYIYFNSDRTGRMQIWRMKTDGSDQEQVFEDDFNNWFPHLSPDGRQMVFLSYDNDVKGHPADKDVTLRRMALDTKKIDVIGQFLGGQGTINVPCWSPDGKRIAFVTYQLIP
jgi:Tol biopolymer transport system component